MVSERKRWISFDPTVHAGHVINAVALIAVATGLYYKLSYDIEALQVTTARHERQLEVVAAINVAQDEKWQRKIEESNAKQEAAVERLRSDINDWFLRLDQKLDNKKDK